MSAEEEHYWAGLTRGELRFQRCARDGHAWLPPRPRCPRCLGTEWAWEVASGRGTLVSWVVYHYAATPALAAKVPYDVALVRLAEGPGLISRLSGVRSWDEVRIDLPVELVIEQQDGRNLPAFRLA